MKAATVVFVNSGQPPPPYIAQPVAPPVAVVMTGPVGSEPIIMACPSCRHQIATRVERAASSKTHIIACLLCLFVCWPCVCVPYCVDSCNNANHYCPNCNAYIGSYNF
ncbi:lipopolysaccharide-induced tumor necrosis factor-alpha factor homolog isoform X2 [Galleria mellonella]|uniref:Lipopolysaccharide-induced tumor necrosis factor-alpha factor homolog isoform X2 n=1 Tax=Galleria mellonella TaxID=7137 RepID=A0ABM3MJQ9_GALME|nr:lipopolysaccharide-induced tumor necrosis factor-alpha factor homolog isoform X2 [Galleria mellonella]